MTKKKREVAKFDRKIARGWGCPRCGCPTATTVGEVEFQIAGRVDFDDTVADGLGWRGVDVESEDENPTTSLGDESLCCDHCFHNYDKPGYWEDGKRSPPPFYMEIRFREPYDAFGDQLIQITLDREEQLRLFQAFMDFDNGGRNRVEVSEEAVKLIRSQLMYVLSAEMDRIEQTET